MARIFECRTCGKAFASKKADKSRVPAFCSKVCYAESIKKYKDCCHCGKRFADYTKLKYCSKACQSAARKGNPLSTEWKAALSVGRQHSEKCKGPNLYNWKGGHATHKARLVASRHKRRSAQQMKLDQAFIARLLQAQNNACFYCDADLTSYKALEHLTPLSKGGDNHNENLVYSCKSCNSKKRQKTLEQYAEAINQPGLIEKRDKIHAIAAVN